MRVLFVALVVLLTLTSTKGNVIDIGSHILCKMNEENPEKVNDLRYCMESIFKEKSDWVRVCSIMIYPVSIIHCNLLPDAYRGCEFAKLPYQKYEEFLNNICAKERYEDLQDAEECVSKIFVAVQEDPENILDEIIYKCL
ncbi:uncharacterized protein LOC143225302 isoform X1 [Tachypleus tridentatus]|uniref:uncharacterized protein LOC143225302 isoform X1 n=1 Tax=Tachypleus tridentatus TaxID=6853 RepID=UPI003FD323A8